MHARPVVPGLPALVLAALIGTMAMMSFVAVIGPVVRLLGLSEWHAGLSVTAAGVLWMLAARRWGQLSDRIGRKRVLLLAMGAYTGVYLALAMFIDVALQVTPPVVVSVLVLVGARGLIGLFYAAVPPTAAALIADQAPAGQRTQFLARLGSANALGMVLGPAAAGWLAYTHLSLALYVAALLPLLALALLAWRLPSTAPAAAASSARRTPLRRLDRRLRLPQLAAFLAMVSVTIAQVTVGFFAIDRLGLAAAEGARMAGIALTAVGVGLILAQALVMKLEVPPRRWIVLGALIAGIGFASVAAVQQSWQLPAAYALAAFGMGFVFPSFQALAADAVQAHEQGAAAGTVAAAQGLGMVVGPMLGTLLYRGGPSLPYLLVGVLLLLLCVLAAAHRMKEAT
ncbi:MULTISPECIES: MFS transporter [unclassified Stenotrophomonas]|jgi:MFS family permease|uniref:MFS transporter n=1 Tax=Stenotrophomonas TaxID=40323 RepID=UPI001009AEF5|nr:MULTISPECIES: MFS transporter [unclassified Stenotrophomonas]HDS1556259.1 MFS transporter [Stenotrophomonas maltophilia]MBE5269524.1 MFS transporter [Stenotrophomonas sp. B2]RXK69329.1 MFS transporter [Stenotrophomonas sp. MA5]HDS1649468.1 MFS transporter [Stenotrophomonas maltophilia]HEL7628493.1 MFS transporter [Stenotrophomonas maltophilia]